MITIEFWRFVPTLKVVRTKSGHKNVFTRVKDHTESFQDGCVIQENIKGVAQAWLQDHWGFVIAYFDNVGDDDVPRHVKYCNHRRMVKTLHELQLEVKLEKLERGVS